MKEGYTLICYSLPLQGKLALCACTHRFVSAISGKRLMAASEKAKENEVLKVSYLIPISITY